MAGVRLGYGISENAELLEKMTMATQPWNISVMAQAAGIAALKENEYVENGRQMVFEEAEVPQRKNCRNLEWTVFPSAGKLYVSLRDRRILFEKCVKHECTDP